MPDRLSQNDSQTDPMTPTRPSDPAVNEAAEHWTGEWSWLIDSYDDGTVFITDDPHDSQAPIADGLRKGTARALVNAHNRILAEERRNTVERIRALLPDYTTVRFNEEQVTLDDFAALLDEVAS